MPRRNAVGVGAAVGVAVVTTSRRPPGRYPVAAALSRRWASRRLPVCVAVVAGFFTLEAPLLRRSEPDAGVSARIRADRCPCRRQRRWCCRRRKPQTRARLARVQGRHHPISAALPAAQVFRRSSSSTSLPSSQSLPRLVRPRLRRSTGRSRLQSSVSTRCRRRSPHPH